MNQTFLAGAARTDITPPIGTLLYGYEPDVVSHTVHDPLYATALALSQNGESVILATLTLGDFMTELCDELRMTVGKATGLPVSRIILSVTHTHSAPNVGAVEGWGEIDRLYFDTILTPKTVEACVTAMESMTEAEMAVGTTQSFVGVNRRNLDQNGNYTMDQNPWGTFDPTMTCISLRNTITGQGILNLIHYGCHGTAAGMHHEITQDWSGVMNARLEKETGVLTAFWDGPMGDVGPRLTNGKTTGDITYVEELGGQAAQDARRAYRDLSGYHTESLQIVEGEIILPYKPIPSWDAIQTALKAYGDKQPTVGMARYKYAHDKAIEAFYQNGETAPTALVLKQTIVCLGDVVLVPAPFEIFSETQLRLRQYAAGKNGKKRHPLMLSNTNGYYSYLPVESALCYGGYEVECFLYNGAVTLKENTAQTLLAENLRLIEELY